MAKSVTPTRTETKNSYASIAGTVGGTLIAMIVAIGIFVREDASAAVCVVAISMAVLGLGLGYFASRRS